MKIVKDEIVDDPNVISDVKLPEKGPLVRCFESSVLKLLIH